LAYYIISAESKELAAQVERDGQRAPDNKPPYLPLESMAHEKEEAKVNEGITKSPETSDSNGEYGHQTTRKNGILN
jgi:hypothetical protein